MTERSYLGYISPRADAHLSWAISSGGEHYLDTVGVTSSNLVSPTISGHGSVGRAQPCQGWGRGFEPRCPLHCLLEGRFLFRPFSYRRSGQVVRQRPAKPLPPVRIRASPPYDHAGHPTGCPFFLSFLRVPSARSPITTYRLPAVMVRVSCSTCRRLAENLWTPRLRLPRAFWHQCRWGRVSPLLLSVRFLQL